MVLYYYNLTVDELAQLTVEQYAQLLLQPVSTTWDMGPIESNINLFIDELDTHRGRITVGHNAFILGAELNGGKAVEVTPFEPDPATFRDDYYYNSATDTLFRRVVSVNRPKDGVILASWKPVNG